MYKVHLIQCGHSGTISDVAVNFPSISNPMFLTPQESLGRDLPTVVFEKSGAPLIIKRKLLEVPFTEAYSGDRYCCLHY